MCRHLNAMVKSILQHLKPMLAPKATVTWTLHKKNLTQSATGLRLAQRQAHGQSLQA